MSANDDPTKSCFCSSCGAVFSSSSIPATQVAGEDAEQSHDRFGRAAMSGVVKLGGKSPRRA